MGVSNSRTQKDYIMQRCNELGLKNVTIITCDINDFDTQERFDRVLSIEMFEHLKNYPRLFENISRWLLPEGKLFTHVFVHKVCIAFF